MRAKTFLGNLTLANQLTFLRLVAVPFFILSILQGRFTVAFALFIGAAITDGLDGLAARWFGQRTALGKETYPIDEAFIQSLGEMPPSGGVALGVDRLLMLVAGADSLDAVLPFR
jgi:hypothetical protein